MPHHDEKGRISPAQSKTALSMRKPLLPMSEHQRSLLGKTMGGMAKEQEERFNYPRRRDHNPGRFNYGGTTLAKHKQKLKVIARGKKNAYRKAYTKVGGRMHKKGLLTAPVEEGRE